MKSIVSNKIILRRLEGFLRKERYLKSLIFKILIFSFITLNASVASAQVISDFQIRTHKIELLDDSMQEWTWFSYKISRRGQVETFLRQDGKIYQLAKVTQPAGQFNYKIDKGRLDDIFLKNPNKSNRISFEVIHLSSIYQRSEFKKQLSYRINAPHGTQLLPAPSNPTLMALPLKPGLEDFPQQPKLFSENVNKRVTNSVSVLTFMAGTAITAFGQTITDNLNNSMSLQVEPDHVFGAGIGIALLSLAFWKKSKFDPNASEQNRTKNRNLLGNWESEKNDINVRNNNRVEGWQRETKLTELNNQKILELYEKEVEMINEKNRLIKETFSIEFF